jgi:hypothetical protein
MLDTILAEENFPISVRCEAEKYAQEKYDEAYMSGCFTEAEMLCLIAEKEIFTKAHESRLDILRTQINNLKVEYLDKWGTPQAGKIKYAVGKLQEELEKLFAVKNSLLQYTCERLRDEAKVFFLYDGDLSRKKTKSEKEVRQLMKNETWRLMWGSCRDPQTIFGKPVIDLSETQLMLIFWSKIYDSIYESGEAPNDKIMEDDLAVDGWLIKKQRERSSNKTQDRLSNIKGDQVYLPAKNQEEARQIYELNSPQAKGIIKSQARDLKKHGVVREQDFSYNKMNKQMALNKLGMGNKNG